ncbi:hypothetical protein DSO57_1002815 [Entomophthora muscae]|uniref:Uncharacterized protein n=1 Tax=Entomophthora muscae TaxID=34485 RepID=A0ACC2SAR8_9FUNG|nr:hypothetical protein DSO57_1002815 [Entomophthora muscae]
MQPLNIVFTCLVGLSIGDSSFRDGIRQFMGLPTGNAIEFPINFKETSGGKKYHLLKRSFWTGQGSFDASHAYDEPMKQKKHCVTEGRFKHCFEYVDRYFLIKYQGNYFPSPCKWTTCDYNATTLPREGKMISLAEFADLSMEDFYNQYFRPQGHCNGTALALNTAGSIWITMEQVDVLFVVKVKESLEVESKLDFVRDLDLKFHVALPNGACDSFLAPSYEENF